MNEIKGVKCAEEWCPNPAHEATVDIYGRPACPMHRAPPEPVSLVFQPKTVTTDAGHFPAHAAYCSCESDVFYLFQIVGQNHFHMQCAQCDQSYCPFGMCAIMPIQEEPDEQDPNSFQDPLRRH